MGAWLFFCFGVVGILSQGVLLKYFRKVFSEHQILVYGLVASSVHFLVYAVSWEKWMPYIAIGLAAVYMLANSALSSIVSTSLTAQEQGLGLGALSAVKSLCAVFGPLMFSQVYNAA